MDNLCWLSGNLINSQGNIIFPCTPLTKSLMYLLGKHYFPSWIGLVDIIISKLILKTKFCWTDPFQETFESIKDKLMTTHVPRCPIWTFPFHIHANASNREIGVALG